MSSDWDEIKRLAADFQRAQLTSTLQKLSERNCIEIVSLLLEKKLLEVVFTNDGKEYITPEHLEREIRDELFVNGGRVNLVEVSKALNVDLSRIEDIAQRIAADNGHIHFMLGQLIDETYIIHIAQEINEKLSQKGEISVSDLTLQFDLPSEFLQRNVVEKHLGKIIRGRQDPANPRNFYTQAYIQRCKSKIRGALAAITSPTNVSVILQQLNVPEKIFHAVLDEVAPAGQVTSKMANAQYVPHIYAKIQCDWVNSFYKQNGFLEYDAISKLGVSDAKQFIRKQFPKEKLMFLKRCAIGSQIIDLTVLASLTECSATKSYLDLSTILPSNMSEEDIEEVFNTIVNQKDSQVANGFINLDSIVFSKEFLADLVEPCKVVASVNAKTAVSSGVYQQYLAEKQLLNRSGTSVLDFDDDSKQDKRDERRKKAASGKAGGGGQGRETKTKSTKKHQNARGGRNANCDSDVDNTVSCVYSKKVKPMELVTINEIIQIINNKLEEESLEDLGEKIAALYHEQFNQLALAEAQELFETTPQTNRRQTHAGIQEKLNNILVDIRLYEKGLKLFSPDVQEQLVKYLLKTLGNDIINELTVYIANECNLTLKAESLNVDTRNKFAQDCPAEFKTSLIELNKSLNKTIEDFVNATEVVFKDCSMIIKKVDKKKDRQIIAQHKEKLCQKLQTTTDPALVLHLTALILFTTVTGSIVHASGKFVALILKFLRPQMSKEDNDLLFQYHDLVLRKLQCDDESNEATLNAELLQCFDEKIKLLAIKTEKLSTSKAD